MASKHQAVSRRIPTGRRLIISLVAAGVGFTVAPLPASAADAPSTAAEAQQLIDDKGRELEAVTEKFNDAREALARQQQTAEAAAADAKAAQARVAEAQDKVREVARTAYTTDQLSGLQAFLTSSSADELLDRVGTLDTLATRNTDILTAAQDASTKAAAAQETAQQAADQAQQEVDDVADQQQALKSQIADFQAEKERFEATADRSERAAASDGSSSSSESVTVTASSGSAQEVVDTALAQLGKPYVWAAAGPSSFDCSGLVQYAYAAAGVSLPHSSSGQASTGTAVSRSELQPGDIIAFYSPVSHVGIYIGDGKMVHAPTSGDVVKIADIDAVGDITAMRRLLG